MNKEKIKGLLSMAAKAGKIISGEFLIEKALLAKKNNIEIVLLAKDISDASKENYENLFNKHGVIYYTLDFTKEELGKIIGKEMRASVAILDKGFKNAIEKYLK